MIAQKISYNIIFVGITKIISIALALYVVSMLTRHLGDSGYGKYTIALSYMGLFMAIADMGLYAITTREISRDGADEEVIIGKIFLLRLLISGSLFVCLGLLAWILPYDKETQIAIALIAIAFLFSSSYSLLNGVFQKKVAMDKVAIAEFTGKLMQLGIVFVSIQMKLPFVWSVIAVVAAMITNFFLVYWFVRKYIKIRLQWDVPYWKSFLKKSLPLGISALATFLYFKIDAILLSFFQADGDVGIYGVAYKVIETLIFFPAMVTGLIFPLLSRHIFTNEEKFHEVIESAIKFFAVVVIPAVIGLFFLSPLAIAVIGGDQFVAAVGVLRVISFTLIGIFFGHLFMSVAIAANLQKTLMKILLIAAAINIILNVILIPKYSYYGAAYTSVMTEIFVMCAVLWLIITRTPFRPYVEKAWAYALAASGMCAVFVVGTGNMLITATAATVVYCVIIFGSGVISINDLKAIRPKKNSKL